MEKNPKRTTKNKYPNKQKAKRNQQIKNKKGKEPPELNMPHFENPTCAVNYCQSNLLWEIMLWINCVQARKSAFI